MSNCKYCHSKDNRGKEIGEYDNEVGFIKIDEKEIYLYESTDVIKIDYCPFCGRKL